MKIKEIIELIEEEMVHANACPAFYKQNQTFCNCYKANVIKTLKQLQTELVSMTKRVEKAETGNARLRVLLQEAVNILMMLELEGQDLKDLQSFKQALKGGGSMSKDEAIVEVGKLQAKNERLRKLLSDTLPHIECVNNSQSSLITEIGEALKGGE